MKFLNKRSDSKILAENLVYKKGDNSRLREELLSEQHRFCAYTERKLSRTDNVHIEHFDPSLKYTSEDDYYNYYAVIPWGNFQKKSKSYRGNRFFQSVNEIKQRIKYEDGEFKAIQENDNDADSLIDYLGFNELDLFEDRNNHVERLKGIFENNTEELLAHLQNHPADLSFPTAIEAEFGIDLTEIIQQL